MLHHQRFRFQKDGLLSLKPIISPQHSFIPHPQSIGLHLMLKFLKLILIICFQQSLGSFPLADLFEYVISFHFFILFYQFNYLTKLTELFIIAISFQGYYSMFLQPNLIFPKLSLHFIINYYQFLFLFLFFLAFLNYRY